MLVCVVRCHWGTGSHPRPCQADRQGGEDSRDQRWRSGLHPAGAGRHPFSQEEVSEPFLPFKLLQLPEGATVLACRWHFSNLHARTCALTHTHTHPHAHAHTHTYEIKNIVLLCVSLSLRCGIAISHPSTTNIDLPPEPVSLLFLKLVCLPLAV